MEENNGLHAPQTSQAKSAVLMFNKGKAEARTSSWHPAFCSAMELEFKEDNEALEYTSELCLNRDPIKLDLLVVKKDPAVTIRNEIGDFFREHNIIEYKSPNAPLGVLTLHKALSYTHLYKSDPANTARASEIDVTLTLVRRRKPVKLLKFLGERFEVENRNPGIYRVSGLLFPLQVVVTKELKEDHIWLRAITDSMDIDEARRLLSESGSLLSERDRSNAGTVTGFAADKNADIFNVMMGDEKMVEEIRAYFAPEIEGLKAALADRDRTLADRDRTLAESRAVLADKDRILADRDKTLAESRAVLADRDAEIAALKERIAEILQNSSDGKP